MMGLLLKPTYNYWKLHISTRIAREALVPGWRCWPTGIWTSTAGRCRAGWWPAGRRERTARSPTTSSLSGPSGPRLAGSCTDRGREAAAGPERLSLRQLVLSPSKGTQEYNFYCLKLIICPKILFSCDSIFRNSRPWIVKTRYQRQKSSLKIIAL